MNQTVMFLPGEPGRKIFRSLFSWSNSKGLALGLVYAVTLALVVAVAFGLRSYTIFQTSITPIPEKQLMAVSIMPQPDESIKNVVDIAFQDKAVSEAIQKLQQKGHKGFLVHLMPRQYMMQGLFAQPDMSGMQKRHRLSFNAVLSFIFPFFGHRDHGEMMGLVGDGSMRLIFSQLTRPNGEYVSAEKAMAFTVKHLPLLRVDVEPENGKVLNVEQTAPRNYWGQMPMPLF